MDCAAEETLVRMRLHAVEGVTRLEIDLPTRRVVVIHETDSALIQSALHDLDLGAQQVGHEQLDQSAGRGTPSDERSPLIFALFVNAAFFVFEFLSGIVAGSLGLVADSLDMLADATVYALSLAAVGHHIARKRALARTSGYLQFGLATVGLVEVTRRFIADAPLPDPGTMIVVSALALVANIAVLLVIARVRTGEAHIEASWIFTANDIKANALVIAAAVAVWVTDSALPDLVAGAIIFGVVAHGSRRILRIARSEN